jgi:hypothetical protein
MDKVEYGGEEEIKCNAISAKLSLSIITNAEVLWCSVSFSRGVREARVMGTLTKMELYLNICKTLRTGASISVAVVGQDFILSRQVENLSYDIY